MCWLAAQVPAAASSRPKLGARSCLPFPRGWQGRSLLSDDASAAVCPGTGSWSRACPSPEIPCGTLASRSVSKPLGQRLAHW